MTKEELIKLLNEPCGDPEISHARAEKNLLFYLNDPEIEAAWREAQDRDNWWYA